MGGLGRRAPRPIRRRPVGGPPRGRAGAHPRDRLAARHDGLGVRRRRRLRSVVGPADGCSSTTSRPTPRSPSATTCSAGSRD
jgi:hypothetical protein